MDWMPPSDISKVKRHAERASYEKEELESIMDNGYVCQVGFQISGQPFIIPMMYYNDSDFIYIHGSPGARIINHLREGNKVVIAILEINGLVLAKRLANNSMNYRSAIIYGNAEEVDAKNEKYEMFKRWIDRMMPGRSFETLLPSDQELKGVSVFRVKIEEFSVKIRRGGPIDEGNEGEIWSGVIPFFVEFGQPKYSSTQFIPQYVTKFVEENNSRNRK
jgi:nitroimidazol reductase NimA-like FMN-containing flavoprotein (pyridoxamine 5'-phosphate oxidase superfamily)